jgi:1-acyl-sn-glycerol-3-phosphate acyltransferase
MNFLRSLLFNIAFYIVTAVMLVASLPFFFILPQGFGMWVVRTWARASVWLHVWVAGVRVEVRGRENIPTGGAIVAVKHQSAFETFALVPMLRNPTIVMKRSIRWLPIFGPYTVRTGMIHVDREGKTSALRDLAQRARTELDKGREIIIFPEGTRRAPGAKPAYQPGIALLYRTLNVSVVPVALNSGLYWPRRQFVHRPGTIVVEFLPAIPPGLDSRAFLTRLQGAIETTSSALAEEGRAELGEARTA